MSIRRLTRTCGQRARNAPSSWARSTAATVEIAPTASRPRTSPVVASTSARARSAACRACRATGTKASPAAVSRTLRLVRWKSRAPNSFSSRAIWWLRADCTTWQRSAARVKPPVSATATTYRICWSSIARS